MNRTLPAMVLLLTGSLFGQVKLAQSGFQFLSIGTDARATGMAQAVTTREWGSGALFFNPAGMANMESVFDVAISNVGWIADINYTGFTAAVRPANGLFGVFGVSLLNVDYGTIQGTMVSHNKSGYLETGDQYPRATALGFGYARALSDRFSVGGQIRYTAQHLGESVLPSADHLQLKSNIADVLAYDFGTLFKTGFKSLAFGMSIRNFSTEVKFEEEPFQLPLVFQLGISMNLMDLIAMPIPGQQFNLHIDAAHPGAFGEQINLGFEYQPVKMLFVRGGYLGNYDERGFTFGVGLVTMGIGADYSFTPFGKLGDVQQFTLRFGL